MQLNLQQFSDFERDGYLLLPRLFSVAEVATLRAETDRLSALDAEGIKRERSGTSAAFCVRTKATAPPGPRHCGRSRVRRA